MQDFTNLTFFEQAMLVILGVAATCIGGAIMAYFRSRSQCFKAWKDMVVKLDKRSFRTEKALILSMKLIDSQTMEAHQETKSELEKIVKEILADEEGKL